MKKAIFTILAVITATMMMAQDIRFKEGDKVLNLGIGLGSTLYSGLYYKTVVPPVSASLEFGFMDNLLDVENLSLGLGGYIGFATAKQEWPGGWGYNYTNIIIGGRGSLHYPLVEKLDTYTGLLLGARIVSNKSFNLPGGWESASGSGIAYSWFVGGRYYFTDNLAGMVELGYGIAYLNLGVAFKLPSKGE